MTLRWLVSLALGTITSAMLGGNSHAADELAVGDKAPDFALTGSDGKIYRLSDFHGKSAVVIAWYPKAFTGG